jgi:hypothetical protein
MNPASITTAKGANHDSNIVFPDPTSLTIYTVSGGALDNTAVMNVRPALPEGSMIRRNSNEAPMVKARTINAIGAWSIHGMKRAIRNRIGTVIPTNTILIMKFFIWHPRTCVRVVYIRSELD